MNIPKQLTAMEWGEVAGDQRIRDILWMHESETAEDLAEYIFGVRFDYQTDCPGYCGPLYLLQGGVGPEWPPVAIIRNEEGRLEVVEPV